MSHLIFPDYLRELNMWSIILRVCFCVICGGAVGIEREWRHRTAGLKTHILVCLGAAVCMITGQYVIEYYSILSIDPTRIGAQVVSGIGFLGVGTIIVTRDNKVKGLSTAAGLWVSACIGLAIGISFFEIALIATACVVGLFVIVKYLKGVGIMNESRKVFYLEMEDVSCIKQINSIIAGKECSLFRLDVQPSKLGYYSLFMGLDGDEKAIEEVVQQLDALSFVLLIVNMDNVQ